MSTQNPAAYQEYLSQEGKVSKELVENLFSSKASLLSSLLKLG
jgi:hypothetical protein